MQNTHSVGGGQLLRLSVADEQCPACLQELSALCSGKRAHLGRL